MEKSGPASKKPYSNSFRSLQAIWEILRRYASREHPLTVREIYGHLKDIEPDPDMRPSLDTLERIFPQGRELMGQLFPARVLEDGETPPAETWLGEDGLHISVETPDGQVLAREGMTVHASPREPFKAPSYSTVDKMLAQGIPFDLDTFPFRLRCVAQVPGKRGRKKTIPYEDWEDSLAEDQSNNVPRRYYLEDALSDAEWRLFSDLILVYPFLTERQTLRFLTVLNRFHPRTIPVPKRYAYKRSSRLQMEVINKLDEAIRKKRKVRILYGEHQLEYSGNTWQPVLRKREKNGELDVEPYALMWSNGNYYLVVRHRGMMNLRADRIMAVELLEDRFTLPPDFEPVRYRNSCPVMYPGEEKFVRLRCKTGLLNTLLDFFGDVPQYRKPETGPDGAETTEVTMSIAPAGVKLFALQYVGSVEVLEPKTLREEIARDLEAAAKKYRS